MANHSGTAPLTAESLGEYHRFFTGMHESFDIIDELFLAMEGLVDDRLNAGFISHAKELLSSIVFEDMDEARRFMERYIDFSNAVVAFIGEMESHAGKDDIEEIVGELLEGFVNLYTGDLDRLARGVFSHTLDIIGIIAQVAGVDEVDDIDEFANALEREFGEGMARLTVGTVALAGENIDAPYDADRVNLVFRVILPLVMHMNLRRKELLAEKSALRRETAGMGRNDSCPCGSGKKFKKCCMQKTW